MRSLGALLAGVGLAAAGLAVGQPQTPVAAPPAAAPDTPGAGPSPGPPPPVPPAELEREQATSPPAPAGPATTPPEVSSARFAPVAGPPPGGAPERTAKAPAEAPPPSGEPAAPSLPPPPPRSVVAVVQVLDKITAETLKFTAPIGKPIRYKTVVFTARVCETRGVGDPQPRPSAYLVIDSQPLPIAGRAAPPVKRVFSGWMFANAPSANPLQHPIYDAWLVGCSLQPVAPI